MKLKKDLKKLIFVLISILVLLISVFSTIKMIKLTQNIKSAGIVYSADSVIDYDNLPSYAVANCEDGISYDEYWMCTYFPIESKTGFINFSNAVYQYGYSTWCGIKKSFEYQRVYLTEDIDLTGHDFIPIGMNPDKVYNISYAGYLHFSDLSYFCGIFDGNGHTIININFTGSGWSTKPGFGLFWGLNDDGNSDSEYYDFYVEDCENVGVEPMDFENWLDEFAVAKICNLRLENVNFDLTNQTNNYSGINWRNIGSVAGYVCNGGIVENVEVNGFNVIIPCFDPKNLKATDYKMFTKIAGLFCSTAVPYETEGGNGSVVAKLDIKQTYAHVRNCYVENFNIDASQCDDESFVVAGIAGALNYEEVNSPASILGTLHIEFSVYNNMNGKWNLPATISGGLNHENEEYEISQGVREEFIVKNDYGYSDTIKNLQVWNEVDTQHCASDINYDFLAWGEDVVQRSLDGAPWFYDEEYHNAYPKLQVFIDAEEWQVKPNDETFGEVFCENDVFKWSDEKGAWCSYQPSDLYYDPGDNGSLEIGDKSFYVEAKENYKFVGWYRNNSVVTANFVFTGVKVTFKNDFYYATWIMEKSGVSETINDEIIEISTSNGEDISIVKTVDKNSKVLIYTFTFLNIKDEEVKVIYTLKDITNCITNIQDLSTKIERNITISPIFGFKSYNVTLG